MIYKDFLNICNDCGLTFDESTSSVKYNGIDVAVFWFFESRDNKKEQNNYEKTAGTILIVDDKYRILSSSEDIEVSKAKIQERMKSIKKQSVDERIDDLNKDFE